MSIVKAGLPSGVKVSEELAVRLERSLERGINLPLLCALPDCVFKSLGEVMLQITFDAKSFGEGTLEATLYFCSNVHREEAIWLWGLLEIEQEPTTELGST